MSVSCLNVCRLCAKYYEHRYMFYKKMHLVDVGVFAWYSIKIRVIFGVQFERRTVDKKSKPTWKLKHANSILEYFEHFCQISSKSIHIILSYTISKFARFFETQCRVSFIIALHASSSTHPMISRKSPDIRYFISLDGINSILQI